MIVKSYEEMNAEQKFAYDAGRESLRAELQEVERERDGLDSILTEAIQFFRNGNFGATAIHLESRRAALKGEREDGNA